MLFAFIWSASSEKEIQASDYVRFHLGLRILATVLAVLCDSYEMVCLKC